MYAADGIWNKFAFSGSLLDDTFSLILNYLEYEVPKLNQRDLVTKASLFVYYERSQFDNEVKTKEHGKIDYFQEFSSGFEGLRPKAIRLLKSTVYIIFF